MVRDGLIEKVFVPAKFGRGKDILCLRLLSETASTGVSIQKATEQDELGDAEIQQGKQVHTFAASYTLTSSVVSDFENLPLWNVTIHRQIVGIIEDAGKTGITLNVCVNIESSLLLQLIHIHRQPRTVLVVSIGGQSNIF